jgi:two-component system chemotaxis sensor kinase CheA
VNSGNENDRRSVLNSESLEIQQAFAIELSEMLADMESALLGLEKHPGDMEKLNRLFRAVHTIKGSAGIVAVEPIAHFCHYIENILARIREHELPLSSSLIALFIECHDHIGSLMKSISSAGYGNIILPQQHSALIRQLGSRDVSFQQSVSFDGSDDAAVENNPDASDILEPGTGFSDDQNNALSDVGNFIAIDEMQDFPPDPVGDKTHKDSRVIRVEAQKLDQMSDLIVELVTASSVLETQVKRLGDMAMIESSVHVSDLIRQIQEKSMAFRMIPVQTLFQRFQRMIYDIGKTTGKNIRLKISGEDTELDRVVAEKLYEPLLHLVRNAADHGIESAPDRDRLGKHPVGTIHLTATHDSGSIVIRVQDDGQGIDLEAVARKAVEKELATPENITRTRDLVNYIFEPGFSTLDETTMLSGRGVGLDVVKKTIETIRGRISVETSAGTGTTYKITIPLSLSMMNGLMVELGGNFFILPIDIVLETLELPNHNTMSNDCIQLRGNVLPCIGLREILCIGSPPPPLQYVVIVKYEDTRIGFLVDRILGEIKTVIKPLGKIYHNITSISGVSILGDGSIALFLEIDKLIRSMETSRSYRLP